MPAAPAARSIARASARLTASGFSIITGTRRRAQASTTAGCSSVLVNAATASGRTRSSIAGRSVKKRLSASPWLSAYLRWSAGSGSAIPTISTPGRLRAWRRKPSTWPCTSPAIATRSCLSAACTATGPGATSVKSPHEATRRTARMHAATIAEVGGRGTGGKAPVGRGWSAAGAAARSGEMPSDVCFSFDRFQLDQSTGRLVGPSGPIPLSPKALAVLEYLAARPSRLVTKDELLDAIWPGVFLGGGALKVCVSEIRRALDDDPKKPRISETAHRP